MIACANKTKLDNYEPIKLEYQMKTICKSRGFEELLGYIDIDMLCNPEGSQQKNATTLYWYWWMVLGA